MSESISVVYEKLGTIAGVSFYHETLLYINSAGQQFFATSGPSATEVPGSEISNVSVAISDASNGTASPYGTLSNVYASVNDPEYATLVDRQLDPNNAREVVATGDDLNTKWQTILNTEDMISTWNLPYSPITQNSNSEANTALRDAGIAAPSDVGLVSDHWAPGADAGLVNPTFVGPVAPPLGSATDKAQAIQQFDEAEQDDDFSYAEGDDDDSGDGGYYGAGGGYYGGGGGGGYYGYYGYYGLSAKADKVKASAGRNVGVIAQHDSAAGDQAAANAAQRGHLQSQKEASLYAASGDVRTPVLEAAHWDKRVITWSAANDGSSRLDAAEQASVKTAFAAWSTATGIEFEQVRAGGDISVGFADLDTADSSAVGYTTIKAAAGTVQSAHIELEDPSKTALVGSNAATATYAGTTAQFGQVVEHEIGHAIGLADDADSHSVMFYDLTSANRGLDPTDVTGARLLSGSSTTPAASADTGIAQLAQAMGSFGVAPAAAWAANQDTMRHVGQLHAFQA
jgi:hypothetical protein